MIIDQFYSNVDKNNFYLGIVSQVFKDSCVIQTENLTWLQQRRIYEELLNPNTINYHVVIDSTAGLFIGEVYQSKIQSAQNTHIALNKNSTETIFPELYVDIFGILTSEVNNFTTQGFKSVGLTDRVYIANNEIKKCLLQSVEIKRLDSKYLQTRIDSFAKVTNLGHEEVSLYPETLLDRHLMTIGTTNSGKSTTALTILDKLINANKKLLIIDPTGEYSQSFLEEKVERLTLGVDTVLSTGKVSFTQWATLFETNDGTQPAVLADAIISLRYQMKIGESSPYIKENKAVLDVKRALGTLKDKDVDFDLSLLTAQIFEEGVEVNKDMTKYTKGSFQFNNKQWLAQKVEHKLRNVKLLEFFNSSTPKKNLLEIIERFMKNDIQSLYIDTSKIGVGDGIGSMIIDLISNFIINEKEKDGTAFVVFIDEVHRYSKDIQLGGYQTGLTAIAREGRKKGVFLFLTTQNPNDVPVELLGQIGSLLIHRLTHKNELDAVRNYLNDGTFKQISKLNQGEAVLTSINLIKDLNLQINKCSRIHFNNTTNL